MLCQLRNENEISELTDECDRFCKYVHRILGAVVTVGVGQVCRDIADLAQSYRGAREAVSYRVLYGASRAINIMEIAPQETRQPQRDNEGELSKLFKMIRLGSEEEVREEAGKYLARMSFPEKSLQQHHMDIMELLGALYRFAGNNHIAEEFLSKDMRELYVRLLDMEPEELHRWLTNISLFFREDLILARSRSTQSFVSKAEEYVRNNYSDENLSLDSICQVLGVSNSYFSTAFKKETGKSFTGYLTDYRMDQAARLLIETSEKSYIIGRSVGYTDPNYFSYVFKRRFGVSPSKYRTEHGTSEK